MRPAALLIIVILAATAAAQSEATDEPVAPGLQVLASADPGPGVTIANATPTIVMGFPEPIKPGGPDDDEQPIQVRIDRITSLMERVDNAGLVNIYDPTLAFHNGTELSVQVPAIFALAEGVHNITVVAEGVSGEIYEESWRFTIDPDFGKGVSGGISLTIVILVIVGILVAGLLGIAGYVAFRKSTTGFNVRKFIARQQIPRQWFYFYVPSVLAVLGVLVGLSVVASRPDPHRFATEYVLVAGVLTACVPIGWGMRRARTSVRAHEEAYAQFLFELADAMRGGLDPLKALKEIARTEDGLLKKPLRQANDNLVLGRPFNKVMEQLAAPMGSDLIARYSKLVADASEVGGEVATVVYTAAKDMDELVKIEQERDAAVRGPMTTMYIAFGVLVMMAGLLVDFAPKLGNIDIGLITGGSSTRQAPRMPIELTQDLFFHLILVSSIGVGLLIGSFTQGSVKQGLLHMSILLGISAVAFPRFALGV